MELRTCARHVQQPTLASTDCKSVTARSQFGKKSAGVFGYVRLKPSWQVEGEACLGGAFAIEELALF
jgi:hypothetical protein